MWIPRGHRDPVSLSGFAVLSDGREIAVHLTDLSKEGCRVDSDEPLRIGESLRLNVEHFEGVAASVRWSLFGTAGLRFDEGDWT